RIPLRSRPSSSGRCAASVTRIWESARRMSLSNASPRRVVLMPHTTYPPSPTAAICVSMSGVFPKSVPTCTGRCGSAMASSAAACADASRRCSRHVHWRPSYLTATESSSSRVRNSCWTVSLIGNPVDGPEPYRYGAVLELFARQRTADRQPFEQAVVQFQKHGREHGGVGAVGSAPRPALRLDHRRNPRYKRFAIAVPHFPHRGAARPRLQHCLEEVAVSLPGLEERVGDCAHPLLQRLAVVRQ